MNYRRPSTPARSGAFTLVELLVSMAVMAVMMLILLQTTATSLNLWRASEGRIAIGREARGSSALISQDLASILVPANPALWPQMPNPRTLQFLTLKPRDFQDEGNPGDVCYAVYRFVPGEFLLQRAFVDSAETFAALRAGRLPADDSLNFAMLATNVFAQRLRLLDAEGRPPGPGAAPRFVEVQFSVYPSRDAAQNAGYGMTNQPSEELFLRAPLPPPPPSS
jgi:prepilin-type N-terminal cleavage/methylation domain-containing protein